LIEALLTACVEEQRIGTHHEPPPDEVPDQHAETDDPPLARSDQQLRAYAPRQAAKPGSDPRPRYEKRCITARLELAPELQQRLVRRKVLDREFDARKGALVLRRTGRDIGRRQHADLPCAIGTQAPAPCDGLPRARCSQSCARARRHPEASENQRTAAARAESTWLKSTTAAARTDRPAARTVSARSDVRLLSQARL